MTCRRQLRHGIGRDMTWGGEAAQGPSAPGERQLARVAPRLPTTPTVRRSCACPEARLRPARADQGGEELLSFRQLDSGGDTARPASAAHLQSRAATPRTGSARKRPSMAGPPTFGALMSSSRARVILPVILLLIVVAVVGGLLVGRGGSDDAAAPSPTTSATAT